MSSLSRLRLEPMPDGEGIGGGGGGEGGGSSECLPMDDLVEAMVRNSQALAEALAADRARREAANRIQRESWEAALKEKDAEIERLRAEASDAKRKLQADASRKVRWEATYDLLLGANQKLAELRDAEMEDSTTCAETANSKEVESCTKLSQYTMDQTASDFRKLKQDYETLSSKKDKEVSALLSEKDTLRSQLDIMQQDYAELMKNKKVEVAQATEAALMVQQSVDELKASAQKKDDEIGRLHSLVKEKDVEIQCLKGWHPESSQKCNNDISKKHNSFRFDDPAVTTKSKINGNKQMQDETRQKRRRVSSTANDAEQSGSDEDGDQHSISSELQSVRDVQETVNNPVQNPLGNHKRKINALNARVANDKAIAKIRDRMMKELIK